LKTKPLSIKFIGYIKQSY